MSTLAALASETPFTTANRWPSPAYRRSLPSCLSEPALWIRAGTSSSVAGWSRWKGVVQVLRDPAGDPIPVLAAVGQMQFEVFSHRLEHEFGAAVELSPAPYRVARRTDEQTAARLSGVLGATVLERSDGTLLALFESPFWLERIKGEHPDWFLEPILA